MKQAHKNGCKRPQNGRKTTFFFYYIVLFLLLLSTPIFGDTKPRLVVPGFIYENMADDPDIGIDELEALRLTLEIALQQTEKYVILDRSTFSALLEEQELAQSELTNEAQVIEIGKLSVAEALAVGTIQSFGSNGERQYIVTIKIIDVETSEILESEAIMEKGFQAILKGIQKLTGKLTGLEAENRTLTRENQPGQEDKRLVKLPPSNDTMEYEELGYIESYDAISKATYAFLVYKEMNWNTGKWRIIVKGNVTTGTSLTPQKANELARKANQQGKEFFTYGAPFNPAGAMDKRKMEFRFYQTDGKITKIEIYLVTRKENRQGRQPKIVSIPWPE